LDDNGLDYHRLDGVHPEEEEEEEEEEEVEELENTCEKRRSSIMNSVSNTVI
jgi:hypothetical protein